MYKRVGNDVTTFVGSNMSVEFTKYPKSKKSEPEILQILNNSRRPLNISEVAELSGLSWSGTKSVLINLVLGGKIECFRSGRAFLFCITKRSHSQLCEEPSLKTAVENVKEADNK